MKSIYLLFGDERYLIRRELDRIKKLNPQAEAENLEGISAAALAEKIFIPSLFSPQKTFVAHDFDFSEGDDNLLKALDDLPQGITLVFVSPQNLDRRTKFFKSLEKKTEAIECRKIPEWEVDTLVSFVESQAASLGKKIKRASAELLIEYVGFDLGMLASEIEKLSVYLGDNQEIKNEDIEKMVSRTGYDAFTLTDALRQRDHKRAYAALERSFINLEDPIELLGLISSQFRNLLKIKVLKKSRITDRYQVGKMLKTSPYYIGKLMVSADKFNEDELINSIDYLCSTDLRLKRGYDPKVELSLLFLELLGEKR